MAQYDDLIVGAGLFGAVFAHEARLAGRRVLVIDRRSHIGGNVYTMDMGGIPVHCYGAHIFHTDDEEVWRYVQRFAVFNRFTNAPLARYGDEMYHLPFNMNTFHQLWGVTTPDEARAIMDEQRREITGEPRNLEEQAICLVGRDIYERLIRGYTEKQWGRPCRELPAFIIRRLPVRFTYDNNYFNDRFQGVPVGGYTPMVQKLLEGVEVRLNTDFSAVRGAGLAEKTIFTGPMDEYYGYCCGELAYRSLSFRHVDMAGTANYQGNAVVNYTRADIPYTRIIEHKHFAYDQPEVVRQNHTVISKEYPMAWHRGMEPYYPVNDAENQALLARYRRLAEGDPRVIFGGRLGQYQYMDMDDTVRAALDCVRRELAMTHPA
ncbi:MAG: UDP-galactopyranose mutase [Aristaeellaceae bacterium]